MSSPSEPAAADPIRVLHEASGVVAIWKPAGWPTQAPAGILSAESWLRDRLAVAVSAGYLGVPHRLDRAVSGVLLFAATPRAARQLSRQFERRQVRKRYLAIVMDAGDVAGRLSTPGTEAVWTDRIEKIPDLPQARVVTADSAGGREAVTEVRVVAALPNGRLLLALAPLTGRMHQLRLQAASRGLPIAGDVLYGSPPCEWHAAPAAESAFADPRSRPIALHAWSIRYSDPDTRDEITIEAPLPTYWSAAVRGIEDACAASTGGEGPPMPREPAYDDKRSQDGEAQSASE
jgi:23S rRNA pseudouridine1911/1915/1917 synthase